MHIQKNRVDGELKILKRKKKQFSEMYSLIQSKALAFPFDIQLLRFLLPSLCFWGPLKTVNNPTFVKPAW